jgi:uncharacterized Ntn-hydrolase superfamily protein
MTYSIVARDPATGDLGVAVQSRWFAVGAGVAWVEPGVGAVATQSFSEDAYGFHGLRLLREGRTAADALGQLIAQDSNPEVRQVAIVDAAGGSAAHTGIRCVRFASHLVVADVTVQANMMERPTVPAAMLATFLGTAGPLARRLAAALRAAEREGGDVRGRQSAALVVAPGTVRRGEGSGVGGPLPGSGARAQPWSRLVDLRVDDHPAPLDELGRLLDLNDAYQALDEAEEAFLRGDAAAGEAAAIRSVTLGHGDDQVELWSAVGLAMAGRVDDARAALAAASGAEPRSREHLRRFHEAGHLPGGEATLRALAIDET